MQPEILKQAAGTCCLVLFTLVTQSFYATFPVGVSEFFGGRPAYVLNFRSSGITIADYGRGYQEWRWAPVLGWVQVGRGR